jgi:hypothetical protein
MRIRILARMSVGRSAGFKAVEQMRRFTRDFGGNLNLADGLGVHRRFISGLALSLFRTEGPFPSRIKCGAGFCLKMLRGSGSRAQACCEQALPRSGTAAISRGDRGLPVSFREDRSNGE